MSFKFLLILLACIFLVQPVFAVVRSIDINAAHPQTLTLLKTNDVVAFEHHGNDYQTQIIETTEDYLIMEVHSALLPQQRFNLLMEDQRDIDLDRDLESDVTFVLQEIKNGKSSLAVVALPPPASTQAPPPEPEPTPEEKKEADSALNQFLSIAPNLQTGLMLLSGKATFFNVVKDYGISYGIQTISQKDPEAGAAIQVFQTLQKMGDALQPAEPAKPAGGTTGSAVYSQQGKIVAAWDGNSMYYNFKLLPSVSKDISLLFKNGSIYAKNIQVVKDFSDSLITISLLPHGSIDINTRLFVNLEGDMKLAESDAKIHDAEITARKDAATADLTLSPHPFITRFRANGQLSYHADDNTLATSRTSSYFREPDYTIRLPASTTTMRDAEVTLTAPLLPSSMTLTATDNSKNYFVLNSKTFAPIMRVRYPDFALEGKRPLSLKASQGLLSASGGDISSSLSLPKRTVTFLTFPVPVLRDGTNAVSISTLGKELKHFKDILAKSPEAVERRFA